jgi:hypothetical protein
MFDYYPAQQEVGSTKAAVLWLYGDRGALCGCPSQWDLKTFREQQEKAVAVTDHSLRLRAKQGKQLPFLNTLAGKDARVSYRAYADRVFRDSYDS